MKLNRIIYFLLFTALIFICSCSKQQIQETKKDVLSDTALKLNDIANFISGKELRRESELSIYCKNASWKKYHEESENAWKNFETQAVKYKYFTIKKLSSPYDTIKTLFYPFSGPDFLFANIFFPKVENMILLGLEPPGSVPSFDKKSNNDLKEVFKLYRQAISDVVQSSFFRTLDMEKELKNTTIDGATPIIMLFLARSNKEIIRVQKVEISENGVPVPTKNKNTNAVVINYRDKGASKVKSITYISVNLADPSLIKSNSTLQFLKNMQKPTFTFVKSATYLMHKPYFSIIRGICLDKSSIILQDDSGISFNYFKKDSWEFQFFGSYSKPIDMFSMYYQEDYLKAFKKAKAEPLYFRLGYNRSSNLLLAIKK